MIYSYDEIRDDIRSGDLIAWAGIPKGLPLYRKIVLWAVTTALRSPYYHVAIAWRVGGRLFLVEASPPLCRIDALSRRGPFIHVPNPFPWRKEDEKRILGYVGKVYSFLEAVMVPFKIKPENNKFWYCSELVKDLYTSQGQEVEGISPEDMVKHLLKYNDHEVNIVVHQNPVKHNSFVVKRLTKAVERVLP